MAKGIKGQFNHNIDAKGRLIIPSKLRDVLGSSFVVSRGFDHCLYVYPNDEWEAFSEKLEALPSMNKDARMIKRFFNGGATDCELDSQGRILLPSALREYAELEKEVIIVGAGRKAEIWDKSRFEHMDEEAVDKVQELADSSAEGFENLF